jgi:hypothetical protein
MTTMVQAVLSFLSQDAHTERIHIGITFLGGCFCLLPLFLPATRSSSQEFAPLHKALKSPYYRDTCIATVSLAIPLVMDTAANITNSYLMKSRQIKRLVRNDFEKLLFMCGVLILPITNLILKNNAPLVYICCNRFQVQVILGVLFSILHRKFKNFWPTRITYILLVLLSIATIMNVFDFYFFYDPRSTIIGSLISRLFTTAYVMMGVIYVTLALRWFIVLRFPTTGIYLRVIPDREDSPKDVERNLRTSMLAILLPLLVAAFVTYTGILFRSIFNWNDTAIILQDVPILITLIALSFYSLRIAKFEVLQGLVRSAYTY